MCSSLKNPPALLAVALLISTSLVLLQRPASAEKKSYVVYLGGHSHGRGGADLASNQERAMNSHYEFLGSFLGSEEKAKDAIFYSYTKHINGFAATLEEEEAMEISKHPSVVSVFPNRGHRLHTTRSWEFLGMERDGRVRANSIWAKARFGEGIIIGNLDTGVWPEAGSFSDDGMGPAPARWRGICQDQASDDAQVRCNRKLIGARYFNKGYLATVGQAANPASSRDTDGHGTHTLSTAAGGFAAEYLRDGVAIGSFHAVRRGVAVVCSAGNSGPAAGTVSNTAPWLVTVGASTMDREFPAYLVLANKKKIKGQSLSPVRLPGDKSYPLISSENAKAANATLSQARLCIEGSLERGKAEGKIVVCMRGKNARVEKGEAVRRAGGVGLVLANDEATGNEMIADAHVLPATHITYSDGVALLAYLNSTRSPLGFITVPNTALDTKPAPFMAAFSSQGPNTVTPQILKPDITAPGVSILAAFTGLAGPTGLAFDSRRVLFNSESGTSMSCPHVAGVAGLLRALHPEWSPAAVKSAIMTTARVQDNMRRPMSNSSFLRATPFSYGAGHVRPSRAADPGLVYDMNATDYLGFLCALGYNSSVIATFMAGDGHPYAACPARPPRPEDLNYPSLTLPHLPPSGGGRTVTRRVRNVGAAPATYEATVVEPHGVLVAGRPSRLGARVRGGRGGVGVRRHVPGKGRVVLGGGVRVRAAGLVGRRRREAPRPEPARGEGRGQEEEEQECLVHFLIEFLP
uniref:Subtilisin-like protease n=1 Tax=Oryza brachyantha TaxID=4533 RepID=J3MYI5_ORYBR